MCHYLKGTKWFINPIDCGWKKLLPKQPKIIKIVSKIPIYGKRFIFLSVSFANLENLR